jgi:hypothetical protein
MQWRSWWSRAVSRQGAVEAKLRSCLQGGILGSRESGPWGCNFFCSHTAIQLGGVVCCWPGVMSVYRAGSFELEFTRALEGVGDIVV